VKPITVTVDVPHERTAVYDHLDVLANHEPFTDHLLVDWELSGPERGVGAAARMRMRIPGPADWVDLTVVEAERPVRSVEETVGKSGRRRSRGTYAFSELPDGGTHVSFTFELLSAPLIERLGAPLAGAFMRRQAQRSLDRMAVQLRGALRPPRRGAPPP
jgi:hypothetical protein